MMDAVISYSGNSRAMRLHLSKKDAVHLARELLELAEGNGVNNRGRESTHWVVNITPTDPNAGNGFEELFYFKVK